jgi:resuscitation-promoting factor RpfA
MEKSPDAFRTISEVAEFLDTPAHVLRFWESRFPQVRPIKRAGGRRYYRPNDVALLSGIKRLLHEDGLTIRGVQKILREQGVRHVSGLIDDEAAEEEDDLTLEADVILDGIVSAVPEPAAVLPFPSAARAIPTPIDAEPVRHEAPAPQEPLAEPKVTAAGQSVPQDPKPAAPAKRTAARISPDQGKLFGDEDPPRDAAPKADAPPRAEADPAQDAAEANPDAMPLTPDTTPEAAAAETADGADQDQSTPAESEPPQEADVAPEPADPVAAKPAQPPAIEDEAFWLASDLRALRPSRLAQIKAEILPLAQRLQALRDRVAELGRVPRR